MNVEMGHNSRIFQDLPPVRLAQEVLSLLSEDHLNANPAKLDLSLSRVLLSVLTALLVILTLKTVSL